MGRSRWVHAIVLLGLLAIREPEAGAGARSFPLSTTTIESGVRLDQAMAPGIHRFKPKLLRAYYDDPDGAIFVAQTRDGLRFRKPRDTTVEIEAGSSSGASVVEVAGKLRMYFQVASAADADTRTIWRATARDKAGKRWSVDGEVFSHSAKPCRGRTGDPAAAVLPGIGVRLYFGCGDGAGIASALSDDGEEFTFEGMRVDDASGPYVVALDDGTLRMFYRAAASSSRRRAASGGEIRTAISTDGLDWTDEQVVTSASDLAALRATTIDDPAAYRLDDGSWRVYVSAAADDDSPLGVVSVRWQPPATEGFKVRMPVDWSDIAINVYGIWPFGVHGADHTDDGHPGWDVEFRPGASVRAAAAGTVQRVFADSNGSGRSTVQLSHEVDGGNYRTVYTNVASVSPNVVEGAAIQEGDTLGAAGSFTQTIGSSPVTFAMIHFQVDDFSQNSGITNVNAVSPETVLDDRGRTVFSALWQSSAYNQELTEPFASNARASTLPHTRRWTRRSGSLPKRIEFHNAAAGRSYTLRTGGGAVVETGSVSLSAGGGRLATIDLTPDGGGASRLGVYDVQSNTLWIDFGAPGAPRPADLASASRYTTSGDPSGSRP